jgi:hypothetical protein
VSATVYDECGCNEGASTTSMSSVRRFSIQQSFYVKNLVAGGERSQRFRDSEIHRQ